MDNYEPAATAFHLTKNADYYNADSISLEGINYQVIQDSQTALMSYQTGALDMTVVNGEQAVKTVQSTYVPTDADFRLKDNAGANPVHPYTKSLLSAIPEPNPRVEKNRKSMTYDYATSGIDYNVGSYHSMGGQHQVFGTDEEIAKWTSEKF